MDYVWGPATAARVGYILAKAAGCGGALSHFYNHHSAWGARVSYGCCAVHTALDLGTKLNVDVPAIVTDIARDPTAHAIPILPGVFGWNTRTSCRDMWKLDTLRPFFYQITGAYTGVAPAHAGCATHRTLTMLTAEAMKRTGHKFEPHDGFRYVAMSYASVMTLAALCGLRAPKCDRYARFVYDDADTLLLPKTMP
jgi:hypothetical protein